MACCGERNTYPSISDSIETDIGKLTAKTLLCIESTAFLTLFNGKDASFDA